MAKRSAGIIFYRRRDQAVEVLLVHPGGPFWSRKDVGSWQIPKGLIEPNESAEAAARREVEEELGIAVKGDLTSLVQIRQAGGKVVEVFALEQDLDIDRIASNHFSIEWPPRSGIEQRFPEVDAARWLSLADARSTMLASQLPILDALEALLRS